MQPEGILGRDGLEVPTLHKKAQFKRDNVHIYHSDVLQLYADWPSPIVILSDGPYGLSSFPGDPHSHNGLHKLYRPHIEAWTKYSTPQTTLWFWNTEVGWATIHPLLDDFGWEYRSCHVWDKGMGHVAGNSNTQTLRKFPVVTEVCVQYVKRAEFSSNGLSVSMQEWLRNEWKRTRLPFSLTNEACGVKNAATRKYFTPDHLWYYPPVDMFVKIVDYANKHGEKSGRPYFSIDGQQPLSGEQWSRMRAKFYCTVGITNVWRAPQVNGIERLKNGTESVHMNQKPLQLLDLIIQASSDPDDVVWEPFGGLCSTAIAAYDLRRACYSAEILKEFYDQACQRLREARRTRNYELALSG